MKEISEDKINQLAEEITLKMFHVGADEVNYVILKMVPTNIPSLMDVIHLTKMPINVRLNSLEEVGLIKRKKGTGKVVPTEFTKDFLALLDSIKSKVSESVKSQLSAVN